MHRLSEFVEGWSNANSDCTCSNISVKTSSSNESANLVSKKIKSVTFLQEKLTTTFKLILHQSIQTSNSVTA